MTAFARLAEISQQKQQFPQRDKFLLLAGIAACHAGWLDIAQQCRAIVLEHNPQHLVGRYPTFPDAIRSDNFETFHKSLERFCTFEKAEHLLGDIDPDLAMTPEQVRDLLAAANWNTR